MRNYCGKCSDILVDPMECRWGYCFWCLSVMLENMDYELRDFYFDDDGDAI